MRDTLELTIRFANQRGCWLAFVTCYPLPSVRGLAFHTGLVVVGPNGETLEIGYGHDGIQFHAVFQWIGPRGPLMVKSALEIPHFQFNGSQEEVLDAARAVASRFEQAGGYDKAERNCNHFVMELGSQLGQNIRLPWSVTWLPALGLVAKQLDVFNVGERLESFLFPTTPTSHGTSLLTSEAGSPDDNALTSQASSPVKSPVRMPVVAMQRRHSI